MDFHLTGVAVHLYPVPVFNHFAWVLVAFKIDDGRNIHDCTGNPGTGVDSGKHPAFGRGPGHPVKIVAIGGDGATSDIGLQALSGAFERGHDFTYICFDNEAYMNTGIQRSSATPFGASTTTSPAGKASIGQFSWKKDMPAIAAAHNIPYVATACHSYPFDLMEKVKRAVETPGPAYVHVLSVCPTGWRCPPDLCIRLGRLAVETGIFPLYEVIDGKYSLSLDVGKLRPVIDYMKPQGRFRHLGEAHLKVIQTKVKQEYNKLLEKVEHGRRSNHTGEGNGRRRTAK